MFSQSGSHILLNDILVYSRAYMDDIVVFSSDWELHCLHLTSVLQKLCDAGLTVKLPKCEWEVASCNYLGFVVGSGKRRPEDCKIAVIKAFPKPTTKSQVRSFLGLTGYYRDFIPSYAANSYHLTEATRKSSLEPVPRTSHLEKEYCYLQSCLCSAPCLCIPVSSDVFCLQTDASGLGIGADLSVTREKRLHPVAYFSRKLSPAERNYSATELEGLAVVASIFHFSVYLYGVHFSVETDHRARTLPSN